jgi:hypothetical protein
MNTSFFLTPVVFSQLEFRPRWGFEGLAINEFQGLRFAPPPGTPHAVAARAAASQPEAAPEAAPEAEPEAEPEAACGEERTAAGRSSSGSGRGGSEGFVRTGDDALGRVALQGRPLGAAVAAQARLAGGLYAGTLALLQRQRPTFARMAPPPASRSTRLF